MYCEVLERGRDTQQRHELHRLPPQLVRRPGGGPDARARLPDELRRGGRPSDHLPRLQREQLLLTSESLFFLILRNKRRTAVKYTIQAGSYSCTAFIFFEFLGSSNQDSA